MRRTLLSHSLQRAALCVIVVGLFVTNTAFAGGPESTYPILVSPGWNLLSVPASVTNGSRAFLFPSAISPAYVFQHPAGYVSQDTLHNGTGFWLKFDAESTVIILGDAVLKDTIEVQAGWNIIGSISVPVDTGSVVSDPPGIITSRFFGYAREGGYQATDTLFPGLGYWVKVSQDGSIMLAAPGIQSCPTTVDYAGKTYHTVQIGSQCWLRENLDVGMMIPGSSNPSNNGVIEKYCYNDSVANCNTYGGFYQWNEAMQYTTPGWQGICPPGWHVSTIADYDTLISTVGGNGNALKAIGQGTGSGAGTNTSGFSALLAGRRGSDGGFGSRTFYAHLWSSTGYDGANARYLRVDGGSALTWLNLYANRLYGYSVRCLKD